MKTRSYKDLIVWQRAITLTRECYTVAGRLPIEERFALASQIRRAAAGVPASIAEGHTSAYRREFVRYLSIAHSSLMELESHLLVAVNVGHVRDAEVSGAMASIEEISRMLRAMRRRLIEEPPRRSPLDARESRPQHTERRNRSQS